MFETTSAFLQKIQLIFCERQFCFTKQTKCAVYC